MKLYLFGDSQWTDDAIVKAIVSDAKPSALIMSSAFAGADADYTNDLGVPELRIGGWGVEKAPTVAVVFACGEDASTLSREAVDAGVRLMRVGIPLAVVRERTGNTFARLDHVARTTLSHDLGHVRKTLGTLYRGVPELRTEISRTGSAIAEALRAPAWESVANAWFEVEILRDTQPRIALWLCGPHHLLGSWTATLAK